MSKYIGSTCSFCGEVFTKDDDIVVCPDCGEPSHRECYKKNGRCNHHSEHKDGYVWSPPAPNIPEADKVECPSCHAVNHKNQPYCTMCSARLPQQEPQTPIQRIQAGPGVGADIGDQWTIGTASAKELAAYFGKSAGYFLGKFKSLLTAPFQGSWNFSAFLFTYLYFFYRKMYKMGFALLGLSLLFLYPNVIYSIEFFKYLAPEYLGVTVPYDAAVMSSMAALANNFTIFKFAIRLCCGFFANKIILKHTLKDIADVRTRMGEKTDNRTYLSYLFYKGSPSKMSVVAVLVSGFIAYMMFAGYLVSIVMPYMS